MPDVSTAFTHLSALSPADLMLRREELKRKMTTEFKGYDDPTIPVEMLHELLEITRTLRRKTSGPPKRAKSAGAPKIDVADLMDSI